MPTTSAKPSLTKTLAMAEIDCKGQQLVGDVQCTYKGEKVTVTAEDWDSTKATRKKACDQGYISTGYVVAVGDGFSVSADRNETTQAIAKSLGIKVATYCP